MTRFSKTSDEILVAISRPEGYEDVTPELVVEDSGIHPAFRWRVVDATTPDGMVLPEPVLTTLIGNLDNAIPLYDSRNYQIGVTVQMFAGDAETLRAMLNAHRGEKK